MKNTILSDLFDEARPIEGEFTFALLLLLLLLLLLALKLVFPPLLFVFSPTKISEDNRFVVDAEFEIFPIEEFVGLFEKLSLLKDEDWECDVVIVGFDFEVM